MADMQAPTYKSMARLKRLARWLLEYPAAEWLFSFQSMPDAIVGEGDSGWADGESDMRSTSGGFILFGDHAIDSFSSTQAVIALSSGEAELNPVLNGGCDLSGD